MKFDWPIGEDLETRGGFKAIVFYKDDSEDPVYWFGVYWNEQGACCSAEWNHDGALCGASIYEDERRDYSLKQPTPEPRKCLVWCPWDRDWETPNQ